MPPPSILPTLPVSTTPMIWGVEIQAPSTLPPPGVSLVGQDGSMITSPPPSLQESLGESSSFHAPNIFHPRWSISLRGESSLPPSTMPPPSVEEPKRPSTIPPPGVGREKTMGIMGRSIYKELRGLGYENNQMLGIATWFLSLVTDMMQAEKGEERRDSKGTPAHQSGLTEGLDARFQAFFRDLRADGYAAKDLVWIANELLAQVIKNIPGPSR
ncbi:MAG TPA: hypothetical protein VFX30_13045 [bacterium]|nr:hypothetical protein [bacterium]